MNISKAFIWISFAGEYFGNSILIFVFNSLTHAAFLITFSLRVLKVTLARRFFSEFLFVNYGTAHRPLSAEKAGTDWP